MDFIHAHPYVPLIAWWVFSAAVGALPAPTAQSSKFYGWLFSFSNTIAANIARAYNTAVEKSPNWQAAVDLHISGKADKDNKDNKDN